MSLQTICREYFDQSGVLYDIEMEKNLSPYQYHDEVCIADTRIKYSIQCNNCGIFASPSDWRSNKNHCPLCQTKN